MRSLQRRSKISLKKVDEEYQDLDYSQKAVSDKFRPRWNRVTDSLNVIRICRRLSTTEAKRMKLAMAEYNRVRAKYNSLCESGEFARYDSTRRQKLEQDVEEQRNEVRDLARQLKYMMKTFGMKSSSVKEGESSIIDEKIAESGSKDNATSTAYTGLKEKDDQVCSICRQDFDTPTVTKCGHQFCFDCMKNWVKKRQSCPTCRQKVRLEDLTIIGDNGEDDGANKEGDIMDLKAKARVPDIIKIKGRGEFGVKVETLVRYLFYIGQTDPGAKSLVFSHFPRSLGAISAGLKKNGLKFAHLKGRTLREKSSVIEKFKTDPNIQVMLMSLRSDASGLTLVAATHVFLFEPSFNLAVEQQAINRVHRIGQTKPCKVYRFIVQDSIEQQIHLRNIVRENKPTLSTSHTGKLRSPIESEGQLPAPEDTATSRGTSGSDGLLKQANEELKVGQLLGILGIDSSN
eukprot:CAMPEP_0114511182 /NCGR_PEP_ID=MMETSP0109-20121206/14210_1 /TAXON_ID=29199 /ORGANISM="Chlorarachnion reptans, Strain CCCM449" /LENGTH=457 /DNA_ID=CAMNT_0001690591 /DNA_START=684 /DNA_END=2057 /DNA_ORIENTATION=-